MSIVASQSALRTSSILSGAKSSTAADLVDVGPSVDVHLLGAQRRTRHRATRRVPHLGGEVADDEHRLMSEILKLAEFVQNHRMAEVDIRRGRVDTELHPQRSSLPELGGEPVVIDALHGSRREQTNLLVNRGWRGRHRWARYQRVRSAPRRFATMAAMTPRRRLLAALVLTALVAAGCRYTAQLRLPDEQAVSSRILWSDGSLLTRVHGVEDRDPVKLDAMAPTLPRAVIAIEDSSYYRHGGVELRGIVRALRTTSRRDGPPRVAPRSPSSTSGPSCSGPRRRLKRKLREAVMAIQLEERYSKRTILERYLNTVYFGNGAYGVQAAARTYFGKDASEVDLAQSRVPRRASSARPTTTTRIASPRPRSNGATRSSTGCASSSGSATPEATFAGALPLGVSPLVDDRRYPAPFFVEKVKQFVFDDERFGATRADRQRRLFQGGLTIETTLDPAVAARSRHRAARPPHRSDRSSGGLVAIDPTTGHVKAYASSQDFWGPLPVRQVRPRRRPQRARRAHETAREQLQAVRPRDRTRAGNPAHQDLPGQLAAADPRLGAPRARELRRTRASVGSTSSRPP